MTELFYDGIWTVPTVLLLVVALQNFNSPPTNRSGTTFLLFTFGVVVYYTSLLTIWLILVAVVKGGGLVVGGIKTGPSDMIGKTAPLVAALLVLVGGYFKACRQLDKSARAWCIGLAYIPREADRLASQLAKQTTFSRDKGVASVLLPDLMRREQIDFHGVDSDSADPRLWSAKEHFANAMYLYSFVCMPPPQEATQQLLYSDPLDANYRASLLSEKDQYEEATAKYESLIGFARKYFGSPPMQIDLAAQLASQSNHLFQAVCSLVSRIVLHRELTEGARRRKLNELGFQYARREIRLDPNPLSAIVLASFLILNCVQLAFTYTGIYAGTDAAYTSARWFFMAMMISLETGISIYIGTRVAYRAFASKSASPGGQWPPLWAAIVGGVISVLASVVITFAFLILTNLETASSIGDALNQAFIRFTTRSWAWMVFPFIDCVTTALICHAFSESRLRYLNLAIIGAAFWGSAFLITGLTVISLVAAYSSQYSEILLTLGVLGIIVGAIVLPAFRASLNENMIEQDRAVTGDAALLPVQPGHP